MKRNNLKKAVTMLELVLAMALFSVIMMIVLDSFIKVINYNRQSVQNQGIQDHAEFLFQLMGREIRFAKINYSANCATFYKATVGSGNGVATNQVYKVYTTQSQAESWPQLMFENANGECVRYFIAEDNGISRLKIQRYDYDADNDDIIDTLVTSEVADDIQEAWVTPIDMDILALNMDASDFYDSSTPNRHTPASVHYHLKLKSNIWDSPEIVLDNFITSRSAEQF